MMKWALTLVLVGVVAGGCPTLSCTDYLDPGLCGYLEGDRYLVKSCGEGKSCPLPKSLNDSSLLVCESSSATPLTFLHEFALQADNDGLIRHEGESCIGLEGYCLLEEDLVCACTPDCTCVQGGKAGDSCESIGCAWGASCLAGTCTKWFTQAYGTVVSDSRLCASMEVDDSGACLRSDTNAHDIFAPCETDLDCIGTLRTRGHCQCGGLGLSYCVLKSGDQPYEHLKSAHFAKSVSEIQYWQLVIEHWAFLQRNDGDTEDFTEFPACVDEVWPELALQLRELPALVDFQSAGLLVLGFLSFS